MKKIFTLLSALTLSTFIASAETVTATWTLGEKVYDNIYATVSENANITGLLTKGAGITGKGTRTAKPTTGDIVMTSWQRNPANPKADDAYVDYVITPSAGYIFSPKKLTLDMSAAKFGNGAADFEVIVDGKAASIAKGVKVTRTNESADDATQNFGLSYDIKDIDATDSPVTIRVYVYSSNSGDKSKSREIGMANVVITGDVLAEGDVDTRKPAPISFAEASKTLSWSERESFTAPQLVNEQNLDVVISADGEVVGYDSGNNTFSILKSGEGYIEAKYTSTEGAEYLDNAVKCIVTVNKDIYPVEYTVVELTPESMLSMPQKKGDFAAGETFGGDEVINARTIYSTTKKDDKRPTIFGKQNPVYIQIRTDKAPDADNVYGTEKSGSTSIEFAPVKDLTLYVYGRQQAVDQNKDENIDEMGFTPNDGKSVKLVNQADPTTLIDAEQHFSHWEDSNYAYGYIVTAFELKAGEKYTLFAVGTTYGVCNTGYTLKAEEVKETAAPSLKNEDGEDIAEVVEIGDAPVFVKFVKAAENHHIYWHFEANESGEEGEENVETQPVALADEAIEGDTAEETPEETIPAEYVHSDGRTYTHADEDAVTLDKPGTLRFFAYDPTTKQTSDVQTLSVTGNDVSTSIAEIGVDDDNVPVEYYNLQGMRVENPVDGLYIRRQGNKVNKVIL